MNGESDSGSRSADGTPSAARGHVLFDLANMLVRPTELTQTDSLEKKQSCAKTPNLHSSSGVVQGQRFKSLLEPPCVCVVLDKPASAAVSTPGSVFGVPPTLESHLSIFEESDTN